MADPSTKMKAEREQCTSCNKPIRQLKDNQTLLLILRGTIVQRRGYKCINCGQITCVECCSNARSCSCGSNAWIAMPYIEPAVMDIEALART